MFVLLSLGLDTDTDYLLPYSMVIVSPEPVQIQEEGSKALIFSGRSVKNFQAREGDLSISLKETKLPFPQKPTGRNINTQQFISGTLG